MSAKDINIKIPTYYFFNDIINIKDFDPNNIKKDEKSYKNILLYNIGSVKIKKKPKKIFSANALYLILGKENGYFEEINGNKCLTLVPLIKAEKK